MFDEEYEKLNSGERESFRKTVTSLLCHTFILSHDYDPVTGERFFNAQYGFALRNYELLEDYLGYAGITLSRDTASGVIYISSFPAEQRIHLDKMTTLVCLVLKRIYLEKKEELSLSQSVMLSVGDLVEQMETLGLFKVKATRALVRESLRTLLRFRIIAKGPGALDEKSTRLSILPSIDFMVSQERLGALAAIARQSDDETAEGEDADEEA